MFSFHLCIHYMILKFFNLFHLILFEYVFVIFFNTMNYRESYHLILITYVVCIYICIYRTNCIELTSVHKLLRGNVSAVSWKAQRVQTSERVLYSRGCESSICKWMRPGFRRMETARLRGNATQHAIFSRVRSKILTFYGRRRVYVSPPTPSPIYGRISTF